MAQTTHLASFGPFLVVANFPVAYYNCKYLKNDPPTRICSEGGSLSLWSCRYGRGCGCGESGNVM